MDVRELVTNINFLLYQIVLQQVNVFSGILFYPKQNSVIFFIMGSKVF